MATEKLNKGKDCITVDEMSTFLDMLKSKGKGDYEMVIDLGDFYKKLSVVDINDNKVCVK